MSKMTKKQNSKKFKFISLGQERSKKLSVTLEVHTEVKFLKLVIFNRNYGNFSLKNLYIHLQFSQQFARLAKIL